MHFTIGSFAVRLVASIIIVLLSFNPSGYSYFEWINTAISPGGSGFAALHAFSGVILVIAWVILIRATFRSLGPVGLILASLFIGTFVWVLTSYGLLNADSATAITWIALICLSALLAIGMSWSHIRRRLSGQYDINDADDYD